MLAPSNYLNQYDILSIVPSEENFSEFKNIVCRISSILFWPQYDTLPLPRPRESCSALVTTEASSWGKTPVFWENIFRKEHCWISTFHLSLIWKKAMIFHEILIHILKNWVWSKNCYEFNSLIAIETKENVWLYILLIAYYHTMHGSVNI